MLDLFRKLHEQGTTIIVVTHDALVASCAQREIMLNHGVLVGEKWNDEDARKAYEAVGGKPASTGAQVEGAQNGNRRKSSRNPSRIARMVPIPARLRTTRPPPHPTKRTPATTRTATTPSTVSMARSARIPSMFI